MKMTHRNVALSSTIGDPQPVNIYVNDVLGNGAFQIVNSGDYVEMTLFWNYIYNDYCPGCITQLYFGLESFYPMACSGSFYNGNGWNGALSFPKTQLNQPGCYTLRRGLNYDYECYCQYCDWNDYAPAGAIWVNSAV